MRLRRFFRGCYFLGIGVLLVLLAYGLWRVGGLGRSGVGFVLNGHCVITDSYHHGLVVGSTGCGKTASVVEPYLREALRSGHAGAVLRLQMQALEGSIHFKASSRPPDAGDTHPEHGRPALFASR